MFELVWTTSSQTLCQAVSVCFLVMAAAAACESTSTDSAVLSLCSTAEEQTQTLSPPCPSPNCKSVYLTHFSALTSVCPPFSLNNQRLHLATNLSSRVEKKQPFSSLICTSLLYSPVLPSTDTKTWLQSPLPFLYLSIWSLISFNDLLIYFVQNKQHLMPCEYLDTWLLRLLNITLFCWDGCLQCVPCRRL